MPCEHHAPKFVVLKNPDDVTLYWSACSLSEVTRWLGSKAEELGVEIYPGFAAAEVRKHLQYEFRPES